MKILLKSLLFVLLFLIKSNMEAQANTNQSLDNKQQAIISIAVVTSKGNLIKLKEELNGGLDTGLTINQIRETIVHLYAYCGFPRSIRGLQTLMTVLQEREAKGIKDILGPVASSVKEVGTKYERGKAILEKLTGAKQDSLKTGYSAFAPEIDVFLKEHLFADIFERDVLTYAERELVTISVLASIGGVEPMLQSHLSIGLEVGLTTAQLKEFINVIKSKIGNKEAKAARKVLEEIRG